MRSPNSEADLQLAKGDLVTRIQRLLNEQALSPDRAAVRLGLPASGLLDLIQRPLAATSLDALVRMLTDLGDGVEIVIRPQRRRRGYLRVLQLASVDDR